MFDEFSGNDISSIPHKPRSVSSENTIDDDDTLDVPIYPNPSDTSYHKIIKQLGEGTEKPSHMDEVTIEMDQGSGPVVHHISLQSQSVSLSALVQTMKKNEVAQLFYDDCANTAKLIDWVSIKDILENGKMIKKIEKRGMGYDLVEYKDDVNAKFTVFLDNSKVFEEAKVVSCEVPLVPEGLFEILKTMKLLEHASIRVTQDYYSEFFKDYFPIDFTKSSEIVLLIEINDLKKVEDMYLDGSFYKKVVVEGEGKNLPNPNAIVRIRYKLEIEGKAVLSNFDSDLLQIYMDEDEVPSLWTHCLRQMKEGDLVQVECNMMGLHSHYLNDGLDPKFNYETYALEGVHSCKFFISLISFDMGKVHYNMTYDDRVVEANRIKEAGNKLFKIGRYEKALEKYEAANSSLEPLTDCPYLFRPVNSLLNGNITLCNLRMQKWHEAETFARKILEFNPNDVKALYRRALARIGLQNYDAAIEDLKTAKRNCEEKGDAEMLKNVNKEIANIKSLSKDIKAKEKKIYKNLFQ